VTDYPDINNVDSLVAAIGSIRVLGGTSRSYTHDPATGEDTVGRYLESIKDYLSDTAIRSAIERAFHHSHYVAGVDGMIVSQSRDELTLSYADGSKATFVRVEDHQNAVRVARKAVGDDE
jgi:hypothetical protein